MANDRAMGVKPPVHIWYLWPAITTRDKALRVAKNTQYLAFLFFMFAVVLVGINFVSPEMMEYDDKTKTISVVPVDYLSLVNLYKFEIAFTILLLSLGIVIRRGKVWAVPIIIAFFYIEIVMKALVFPGYAILLNIALLPFAVNGLRGWFALRRLPGTGPEPDTKRAW